MNSIVLYGAFYRMNIISGLDFIMRFVIDLDALTYDITHLGERPFGISADPKSSLPIQKALGDEDLPCIVA